MSVIDNLYNLALVLLRGCIITGLVSVFYIVGMIRYAKKEAALIEGLQKIETSNMKHKENI